MGPALVLIIALLPPPTGGRAATGVRHDAAVRATTASLATAVEQGRRRSETFRGLLDRLEQSDVIAYLQIGSCPDPLSIACLSLISVNASKRFIRITFVMEARGDRTLLATFSDHLIAQIGHELQHAIEIADDPSITDTPSLEASYRRAGLTLDTRMRTYETERAIATARSVLRDLRATTTPPAERSFTSRSRVRSSDARVLRLLDEGAERSSTFRNVVNTISDSEFIVYVEFGVCAFGQVDGCPKQFMATAGSDRYLRVLVTSDRDRRSHDRLLALIAHELQLAIEVIAHPEVRDPAAMVALFRAIGMPISGRGAAYETAAARAIGDAVLSELSQRGR